LANGTTITAISGDYAGAAGSNHGFVSHDELWGSTSEASIRLFEELTAVPTRKNSIRFISTYSGFEGESKLLWDLYKQAVSIPKAKASGSILICPSTATVKRGYSLTGITSRACHGRPKHIIKARRTLSGPALTCAFIETAG
jgi:hypothetical protein